MAMDFPASPSVGQQVLLGGNTYIWDGTAWNIIPQMGPSSISDLPPSNPAVGQFWWRATNGQLYIYVNDGNTTQWVQAAGQALQQGLWEPIGLGYYSLGGSASFDFKNINLDKFQFVRLIGNYRPVGAHPLQINTSRDNGASFDAGASDYQFEVLNGVNTTVTAGSGATSSILLTQGVDAGTLASFEWVFTNFNANELMWGHGEAYSVAGTNLARSALGGNRAAANSGTVARNAFRLSSSGGSTITSLRLTVEGVRG